MTRCTCRHAPEGVIGWDRGMIDRDCPIHGHEALPERPDPQMIAIVEHAHGLDVTATPVRATDDPLVALEALRDLIRRFATIENDAADAWMLRHYNTVHDYLEEAANASSR